MQSNKITDSQADVNKGCNLHCQLLKEIMLAVDPMYYKSDIKQNEVMQASVMSHLLFKISCFLPAIYNQAIREPTIPVSDITMYYCYSQ